jgi:ketosteroid isomerase-like protein
MEASAQGEATLPFVARRATASRRATSRQQLEATRRSIDAYNRRDLDTLRALLHPRVELDWSASSWLDAGIYTGIDAVMRFYADYFSTFEEIVLEPERFVLSGRSVLVPNIARVRGREGIEVLARSTIAFTYRGRRLIQIRLCESTGADPAAA